MPNYDYACKTCEQNLCKKLKRDLTDQEYQDHVLFETCHSINPTESELKEAITCPRCGKSDCSKSMMNINITSYIRGNGYLDKAGVKRDMNKFHLTTDDPYKEYRQPGEVDELKAKLDRGGKKASNTKVYDVSVRKTKKADNTNKKK